MKSKTFKVKIKGLIAQELKKPEFNVEKVLNKIMRLCNERKRSAYNDGFSDGYDVVVSGHNSIMED